MLDQMGKGLLNHLLNRPGARGLLALVLMPLLMLAACGIPDDQEPRNIDPANVQYDLLAPSTTVTPIPGGAVSTATIYLLGPDGRLVGVKRQLAEQQTVGTVVGALLQGATSEEQSNGLQSAIDDETVVLSAQTDDGIAQIDVNDALLRRSPQDQIRAIAQIVFTATTLGGIGAIQILVNSKPAEVPRSDGSLTSGVLSQSDFTALAPPA